MSRENHIEPRLGRKDRGHELACSALGVGLLGVVFCGGLSLLRRRKSVFLRSLMAFALLALAVALVGACLTALRSRRSD
jgi:uncharacterized membrane protein YfcA